MRGNLKQEKCFNCIQRNACYNSFVIIILKKVKYESLINNFNVLSFSFFKGDERKSFDYHVVEVKSRRG